MKIIYIAGKMTGLPLLNFPAFDAAAEEYRGLGWIVINPAEIDRDCGFDPLSFPIDYDWSSHRADKTTLHDIVRRDLEALIECDAILMLPGWHTSPGATAELAVANWLGLEIIKYDA